MGTNLPMPKPYDSITHADIRRGWVCIPSITRANPHKWTGYANRWWDTCGKHSMPYVKVRPEGRYGVVSMDLFCLNEDLSEASQRALQALWREWTATATLFLARTAAFHYASGYVDVERVQKAALAQVADAFVRVVRQHGLASLDEGRAAAAKIREEHAEERRRKQQERWDKEEARLQKRLGITLPDWMRRTA